MKKTVSHPQPPLKSEGNGMRGLIGRTVMIPLDLTTDPAGMQGAVGKVIEDSGSYLTVAFPGNIKGNYTYDAVLALRWPGKILDYLLRGYYHIPDSHKIALMKALKLQSEGKEVGALVTLGTFQETLRSGTQFCSEIKEKKSKSRKKIKPLR